MPARTKDVEPALIVYLAGVGYGDTVTPEDLMDRIAAGGKVLRIRRIGGGATRKTDEPRVSIQVYMLRDADHPRAAHEVAFDIEDLVDALGSSAPVIEVPAEYGGGRVIFDSGSKDSGPVELPWPDPAVQVVETLYRISTRR